MAMFTGYLKVPEGTFSNIVIHGSRSIHQANSSRFALVRVAVHVFPIFLLKIAICVGERAVCFTIFPCIHRTVGEPTPAECSAHGPHSGSSMVVIGACLAAPGREMAISAQKMGEIHSGNLKVTLR